MVMPHSEGDRTIEDFGRQWSRYTDNAGYYGSAALFADILGPVTDPDLDHFRNHEVLDVGSGTGRIVNMLMDAGARRVVAVEPSNAFLVLRANVRQHGDRVVCLNIRGDQLPPDLAVDRAVSIGVLHHIPDPVIRAVHRVLRPGGTFVAWVYGREGNEWYLRLFQPLHAVTKRMPHVLLSGLCHVLNGALGIYASLARYVRLPMRKYMTEVIARLPRRDRYLVIYDQLNPSYAKYYREHEVRALFVSAGFVEVRLYNRHGYSWTVYGRKPGPVDIPVDQRAAP